MTADYHNDHNGDDDGGGSHHRRFHYRHNMTNIISGGSDHDEGPWGKSSFKEGNASDNGHNIDDT